MLISVFQMISVDEYENKSSAEIVDELLKELQGKSLDDDNQKLNDEVKNETENAPETNVEENEYSVSSPKTDKHRHKKHKQKDKSLDVKSSSDSETESGIVSKYKKHKKKRRHKKKKSKNHDGDSRHRKHKSRSRSDEPDSKRHKKRDSSLEIEWESDHENNPVVKVDSVKCLPNVESKGNNGLGASESKVSDEQIVLLSNRVNEQVIKVESELSDNNDTSTNSENVSASVVVVTNEQSCDKRDNLAVEHESENNTADRSSDNVKDAASEFQDVLTIEDSNAVVALSPVKKLLNDDEDVVFEVRGEVKTKATIQIKNLKTITLLNDESNTDTAAKGKEDGEVSEIDDVKSSGSSSSTISSNDDTDGEIEEMEERTKSKDVKPKKKMKRAKRKSKSRDLEKKRSHHSKSDTPIVKLKKRKRSHSRSETRKSTHRRRSPSKSDHRSRDKEREESRSQRRSSSKKHYGRSRSRSLERSRKESRSPRRQTIPDLREKIDKAKLLEIARKNAMAMISAGKLPPGVNTESLKQQQLVNIKSGGKSVAELTDFCKQLAKGAHSSGSSDDNDNGTEDEGEGPFIQHPFKLREPQPSIVMNIRNAVQIPVKTPAEKAVESAKLRIQFPVSSGSQHRKKESEWIPVSPPKEIVNTCKAVVPVKNSTKDKVFSEDAAPRSVIDIGSIVSQRLKAVRKLQENPADVEALSQMYNAQQQMQSWAESKQLPGQFTGSTDARLLTPEELAGPAHMQAWVKKDQFNRAAPIDGGMGMYLLRKMGWNPGEGLGKNKEGTVEPLVLDIKMDKKGLTSSEEILVKKPGPQLPTKVPKDLSGKHPVSAVVELCSKRRWSPPDFTLVHDSGPDHKKNFLFKIRVNNVDYQPTIASPNKKHAKAQAAIVCLQNLGLLPRNYTSPV